MSMFRYFRLDGADGGDWPTGHALKVGAIVRINIAEGDALTTNAWNQDAKDWVAARWTEVANPATASKAEVHA